MSDDDRRPDWRSVDMPVIGRSGKLYSPQFTQLSAALRLEIRKLPTWSEDKSYFWRRSKDDR
jgi:hypothetical protein